MSTASRLLIGSDGALVLTVDAEDLNVCAACPNLHIRVCTNATSANLRCLASQLTALAETVEARIDR
jgi:hypothetical protein